MKDMRKVTVEVSEKAYKLYMEKFAMKAAVAECIGGLDINDEFVGRILGAIQEKKQTVTIKLKGE